MFLQDIVDLFGNWVFAAAMKMSTHSARQFAASDREI